MNYAKQLKLFNKAHNILRTATVTNKIIKINLRCSYSRNFAREEKLKRVNQSVVRNDRGYWILLMIPVTAFGLGTWQILRKFEKEKLIKNLEKLSELEPLDFPENLDKLESMEYYPVKIKGKFDHSKEFLMGPRSLVTKNNSAPTSSLFSTSNSVGYLVITPFKLSNTDLTILVNRGWIPKNLKSPLTRMEGQITNEVELVGVVRLSEKRQPLGMKNIPERGVWMYRDLKKMAEYFGTSPIMVDADASSTVFNGPIGGQTLINIYNQHLSYIFTWYGLCAATLYLWYLKFIKV